MTFLLSQFIKSTLIFCITGLRPFLGPAHCRYPIGCTQYAINQLQNIPLHIAVWRIVKRVLSCY